MLVDPENELPSELDAEEAKLDSAVVNDKPDLPERYRNKSLEDVMKMHQEAEKVIGRQAQEVGEVRKLADELIKQNLNSRQQPIAEEEPEVDFYEDPQKAVRNTIDRHPDIIEARKAAMELRALQTQQKLAQAHPDFEQVVRDDGFVNWVKSSNIRLDLFKRADAEFDFDSANELLSTYKELRGIQTKQATQQASTDRQKTMKSVQVDAGGTGESSKRVYRRADLIRLKMNDPARYDALSDEIMAAYQEGRVK
jgi:hypothetical protein